MDAALSKLQVAAAPTAGRAKRGRNEGSQEDQKTDVRDKMLISHDHSIRMLLGWAEDCYKLPGKSDLAVQLSKVTEEWKASKPKSGAHPHGHIKLCIMGKFIQFVTNYDLAAKPEFKEQQSALSKLANDVTSQGG